MWVTRIEEELIYVDANHPLAGKTLTFDVEVVSIRDATATELGNGYPHRG